MGWPDIHWLARDKGGLVAALFEAGFDLSLPMEPELAPCGWPCPHRPPTVMGSIGNLVCVELKASINGVGSSLWVGSSVWVGGSLKYDAN
jgi:hypothetical protein